MRIGLIDIGSNTTKVLIADCLSGSRIQEIAQTTFPCRLIKPSKDEAMIGQQNIDLLLSCIQKLKKFAESHNSDSIFAVATEGLRRASNSSEIVDQISSTLGINLTILSGEQEATGIAEGVLADPYLSTCNDFLALDIGGGSLEIIQVVNRQVKAVKSMPIGAVSLAQQFLQDSRLPYPQQEIVVMENFVSSQLKKLDKEFSQQIPLLVGCGGTLVYLRKLLSGEAESPQMTKDGISKVRQNLSPKDIKQRILEFPELPADRADIFPAGLVAIECVMTFLGVTQITHSYYNLRHGLIRFYAKNGSLF